MSARPWSRARLPSRSSMVQRILAQLRVGSAVDGPDWEEEDIADSGPRDSSAEGVEASSAKVSRLFRE